MDWERMVMPLKKEEINKAIRDKNWQAIRISLLGTSLEEKYERLSSLWDKGDRTTKVQIANYVNALKRGGLIK
jgi:hypothetical protein